MKQHEEGDKFDLIKYRLESAKSDLKSAKILEGVGVFGKNAPISC